MINATSQHAISDLLLGGADLSKSRSEGGEPGEFMNYLLGSEALQAAGISPGHLGGGGKYLAGETLPDGGKLLPLEDLPTELSDSLKQLFEQINDLTDRIKESLSAADRIELEKEIEQINPHALFLAGTRDSDRIEKVGEKLLADLTAIAKKLTSTRSAERAILDKSQAEEVLKEIQFFADKMLKGQKGESQGTEAVSREQLNTQRTSLEEIAIQKTNEARVLDIQKQDREARTAHDSAQVRLGDESIKNHNESIRDRVDALRNEAGRAEAANQNRLDQTRAASRDSFRQLGEGEPLAENKLAQTEASRTTESIDTKQGESRVINEGVSLVSDPKKGGEGSAQSHEAESTAFQVTDVDKKQSVATQLTSDRAVDRVARSDIASQFTMSQRALRGQEPKSRQNGITDKSAHIKEQSSLRHELMQTLQGFKSALTELQGESGGSSVFGANHETPSAFGKSENWSMTLQNRVSWQAEQSVAGAEKTQSGPAVYTVTVPVLKAEWAMAVGQRLTSMINNRVGQAKLKLNPEELGPVEIKIAVEKNQASVAFTAQHATTRQALEEAMPKLREMLETSGYELADSHVGEGNHQSSSDGGREEASSWSEWGNARQQRVSGRAGDSVQEPQSDQASMPTQPSNGRNSEGRVDHFV
jgi:flagellar hook-length control protein FliK